MKLAIKLPNGSTLSQYQLRGRVLAMPKAAPQFNRTVYAAAHVVSNPLADTSPLQATTIDWDTTLQYRHHLWSLGFQIAEAMDTSQRGMGLDWDLAKELISRSLAESRSVAGAGLACGAGTDQLTISDDTSLDHVIKAYEEQFEHIEKHSGTAIMMASRALAKAAKSSEDYQYVYKQLLSQAKDKVILHWLGNMFDPQLEGYWGGGSFEKDLEVVLKIIADNQGKVEGIKISLLEERCEVELRRRLPPSVKCYTGDDFNYAPLIEGDGTLHSHALLGIFDAVAVPASIGLSALAKGDLTAFHEAIAPTVPLSRKIFEAPTQCYKAGIVFLAWLNGHQNHFIMPGGMQAARNLQHYAEVFRLADKANVFSNPELAVKRMGHLLACSGVE